MESNGIPIRNGPGEIDAAKNVSVLAAALLEDIIGFIDDTLGEKGFKVVQDDETEEPVVTSGGKVNGHGHVTLNFYFKKKE